MYKKMTFAALIALAGLVSTPALAQKSADTLRWASTSSIPRIDPYYNTLREPVILNGQLVWDTLIYRDPDKGEYKPLLAKSWRWLNDVTLEFTLREDVKWHDGQPLTADDAVYTYNYVSDEKNKVNTQSTVNWIKNAEKTGPHTFKLHLKAPFPAAFEYLAMMLPVMPKDFFGPGGVAGANGRLVGTGPYRIVSFAPGSSIELERFEGYFSNSPKGKGGMKKIRYRTIPDNATQIAELLSGGLDWIWNVPREQAQRLGSVKKLSVNASETMRISFLSFNMRDMSGPNPVQNPKVRQAIAHAIDREKLVKHVVGEGSRVIKSACYYGQWGCRQDVTQYNYDPAKARKLLAEAGYPDGLTLELVAWRNREWTEALTGYLNTVGIKTNITQLAYGAAMDRIKANAVHLYYGDWASFSINDVSAFLNVFYTLSAEDMAQDKELAGWLKNAAGTIDEKVRKANYDKALAKIADQLYMQPLWSHPGLYAHTADLEFKPYPDENPRLFLTHWKK